MRAETPIIRDEEASDAAAIRAVHASCFPTPAEADLVDNLRAAGRLTVSLVALADEAIVGHVAFSPVSTDAGVVGLGLAPVAVIEGHRREGVAAKLIQAGLEACRKYGCGWVVVLGSPEYYSRFGFQAAAEYGLSDEYGGGPAFQVLELTAGQVPRDAGPVRYAPEFAVFA